MKRSMHREAKRDPLHGRHPSGRGGKKPPVKANFTGPELRPYQVLIRPLVTEKGTHQSTRYNAFAFQVALTASKTDIKNAVEELFGVRVTGVRTMTRWGKKRRTRIGYGQGSSWKKALVTLHEDDKIEFI